MLAKRLMPILNVSDIAECFGWFEKLGWKKGWEWGDPPTFGGVCSNGRQGRLDVDLSGRRRRDPSAVPGAGSRRRLAADRHAVGRPRDARTSPGWSRLQNQ